LFAILAEFGTPRSKDFDEVSINCPSGPQTDKKSECGSRTARGLEPLFYATSTTTLTEKLPHKHGV
jgi:hypothetical protein